MRPPTSDKAGAPVIVRLPPPWSVRASQIFWVMSLIAGAAAIVYLFIIRKEQLPEIVALVKGVDDSRADATYDIAADILFWSVFGVLVLVLMVLITMMVSFANRRPNARWWQFGAVVLLGAIFLLARELVTVGERGQPLERLLLLQMGLSVVALLLSTLPGALRWTRRKHDVRQGPQAPGGGEF